MKADKGRELKPHIGIFGRRNNGKSSLINALAGQDVAIVSAQPGTTTDPVRKSVEIFGIGPVILVDTAGIDDSGDLGELRIRKTLQVIKAIDLAIIVITDNSISQFENELIRQFGNYEVPYIFVHNKSDLVELSEETRKIVQKEFTTDITDFSSLNPTNKEQLIEMIIRHMPETAYTSQSLLGGLLNRGDIVMLITPIDNEAPEGRMILPQVQAIRDVLDNDCINVVLKETEVEHFLKTTGIKPRLAVTDSQMFGRIDKIIPKDIPLTGFSVLLARHKGPFGKYMEGTPKIDQLNDGDRVLILESCTHQVNCDDIGRYKIPTWLSEYTGKKLEFDIVAGLDSFESDFRKYALIVQCGGCMITRKQVHSRLKEAIEAGIPITNYGMAIAWTKGIYQRAIEPFAAVSPLARG
ncbi:MAG TPA: [FeFe] hydrogenase H-cluster maturation GTPase HydF [Bacteroidales bacterium]|nr:[FeFe] hydrogenase H-cluster maturation GTPase HydF [Bacteroidales bacterium]